MAVSLKSWGTLLSEVQTAISSVETSQRYEFEGRMVQRADLAELHSREKFLIGKLETEGDVIVGSTVTRGSAMVSFS